MTVKKYSLWIIVAVVGLGAWGVNTYFEHQDSERELREANLGFEIKGEKGGLRYWGGKGRGYQAVLDSAVKHGGKYSLLLASDGTDSLGATANAQRSLKFDYHGDMKITMSGYIRTEDLVGSADLYINFIVHDTIAYAFHLADLSIRGTTPWKKYSFTFTLPSVPDKDGYGLIRYGVRARGLGKVWFDDLWIEADGKPFTDYLEYKVFG
jgi:hypothetical protein